MTSLREHGDVVALTEGLAPILVVDDDHDVRETVAAILELTGYCVHQAIDGRDALDQLNAGLRPGLILLDLRMPRCSGYEALAELAASESLSKIPVLIFSADAPAQTAGLPEVLHKPVDAPTLIEAVARTMRSKFDPANALASASTTPMEGCARPAG